MLFLIPTYNECESICNCLKFICKLSIHNSILVVDDNSPDGTADAVRSEFGEDRNVHVLVRTENKGYGQSLLDGFRWAIERGHETVITMDADLSHDPQEIPKMLEQLKTYDVCIGSRYVNGVRVINWGPSRLLLSLFANIYVRSILGLPFYDNTSGFRAYKINVIKKLLEHKYPYRGYSFLVALLWHSVQEGFSVCEHPITFYERRQGNSKMSKSIIFEAVFTPFRLRIQACLLRIKYCCKNIINTIRLHSSKS